MPDIVQTYIDSLANWYASLSITGKYLVPLVTLAAIGLIVVAVRAGVAAFILLRRFIRRKLIPRNTDLHLDRDRNLPRIEPTFGGDQTEAQQQVYGSTLKERIEKMRKEAPFRRPSNTDEASPDRE